MSSTPETAVAATTPLAMFAVARHMLDQYLPAPSAIEPPMLRERAVRVTLYPSTLEVWVQSLQPGAETTTKPITTAPALRDREYVTVTGHVLSDIGLVAVELRSSRVAERFTVVSGGAA